VVAVYCNGNYLFGLILADYVFVQELLDFTGFKELEIGRKAGFVLAFLLLLENLARLCDTLIADMGVNARNHQVHVLFVATAKRAGYFSHKVCFLERPCQQMYEFSAVLVRSPSGPLLL